MIRKWLRDRKRMKIAQRILEGENICRECGKPPPTKLIPPFRMQEKLGDCESCRKVVYRLKRDQMEQVRKWISQIKVPTK